jgi:hypothetical protein
MRKTTKPPQPPVAVKPRASGPPDNAINLPPGYIGYLYFAFNPTTQHWIYSNDNATWVDNVGNPVPAQ